jgi:hypothetical protein
MKNEQGFRAILVPPSADLRNDDGSAPEDANDDIRDDRAVRRQFTPLGFGTRMARRLPVEY